MKLFKKIAIIGVGLLGGSLGLAIKKKKLAKKVVGFFRHREKINDAIKRDVVDEGTDRFSDAVKNADFIILCTPVRDIVEKLRLIKRLHNKTTLITDVGSTKSEISKAARGLNFIGSHPLAGSELSGIRHARADLFKNSLCILTYQRGSKHEAINQILEFWRQLNAKTVILEAAQHDKILAFVSHLPHIAAFSLIDTVPNPYAKYGARGLKDTTRIALSNPKLWSDIFLSNRKNVLKSINSFEKSIFKFKKALIKRDSHAMSSFLSKSQKKRKNI